MKLLQRPIFFAMALLAAGCTLEAREPEGRKAEEPGQEDAGETSQALVTEVAADGPGFWKAVFTDQFYNNLTVTNVLGGTFYAGGGGVFTTGVGLPATAQNIAACEDSYALVYTYKYLNGSWVPWLSPQTVYAVARTDSRGNYITGCENSFGSGWIYFGQSTKLAVVAYAYSSDGSTATKFTQAMQW